MPKFLGFQLCNLAGANIQGDPDDPTGLASFEIMTPERAAEEMAHIGIRSFLLMPIYDGDVEEPTIVPSTKLDVGGSS